MDALEQLREILSNSSQTASLLSELERLNRNLESLISSDLSDESINRLEDWFENLEEMYEDVSFPDDETARAERRSNILTPETLGIL